MTSSVASNKKALPPVHPGEILVEEFMKPHALTAYGLAGLLHVQRNRIERVTRCQASVTPDTALRLGRLFGTTPLFWLSLQAAYDLATEPTEADLDAIAPIAAAG